MLEPFLLQNLLFQIMWHNWLNSYTFRAPGCSILLFFLLNLQNRLNFTSRNYCGKLIFANCRTVRQIVEAIHSEKECEPWRHAFWRLLSSCGSIYEKFKYILLLIQLACFKPYNQSNINSLTQSACFKPYLLTSLTFKMRPATNFLEEDCCD